MMFKKRNISQVRKIIVTTVLVIAAATAFYISAVHAEPVTYYFNNAVNQSPAEQGNYWYDAGFNQPALELPDFDIDIVYVSAGVVFDGNARFNGSATNDGQVTGNASFYDSSTNNLQVDGDATFYQNAVNAGTIQGTGFFYDSSINNAGVINGGATFYGDLSENIGNKGSTTITGTQSRTYTDPTVTVRDFVALGPWTVVADGVEVDVTGATFDGTTTFSAINGGSFIGAEAPVTYYFNNAVNTDPAEVGNYWLDADCLVPASVVPNFTVDEVFVGGCNNWSEEVIFNGDATFNASATNKGTVTGNAVFNDTSSNFFAGLAGSGQGLVQGNAVFNDNSSNDSTVDGNAEFHGSGVNSNGGGFGGGAVGGNADFYDNSVNGGLIVGDAVFTDSTQNGGTVTGNATFNGSSLMTGGSVGGDATFNGDLSDIQSHGGSITGTKTRRYSSDTTTTRDFRNSWIVVADGAVVTITDAIIDQTTTLQTLNGGSFFAAPPTISSSVIGGKTLTLTYNKSLDTLSVPATTDYHLTRNGIDETINNVSISNTNVILTLGGSKAVTNDSFVLDYTAGASPLQSTAGTEAANLVDRSVSVSLTFLVGTSPNESIAVANKVYILNSNNVAVLDPATDSVSGTININGAAKAVVRGNKLYVIRSTSSPGTVSVINTLTDTVLSTINVNNSPNNAVLVGTKLYVFHSSNSSLSVIDTDTDTLVNTIALGSTPSSPVVVGRKLYALNQSAGAVKVVDTTSDTVTATINVGAVPRSAALVGTKLYVSRTNNISVIDTLTDAVTATITTNIASAANALAVGTKAYFSNSGLNTVTVVNSLNDSISATIPVGTTPGAFTVFGTELFVPNAGSNTVSVIDTTSDTVISTPSASNTPRTITVLGEDLYVTNQGNGGVTVIHLPSLTEQLPNLLSFTSSTPNGAYHAGDSIAISAVFARSLADGSVMTVNLNSGGSVVLHVVNGNTLSGSYTIGDNETTPDLSVTAITYASVTDTEAHTLTSYSLASSVDTVNVNSVPVTRNLGDSKNISIGNFATISTGQAPQQISSAVTVDSIDYLYVTNKTDNTVKAFRKTDGLNTATITVGTEPAGIATSIVNSIPYIYVANTGSSSISVINALTNTVVATISVGVRPSHLEIVGSKLYISNSGSNTVSVINTTTNTVTATIAVGITPRALKTFGTNLYVANYGDLNRGGVNYISVIDTGTDTVSDTITLPKGNAGAYGLAIYGQNLYITNPLLNEVWVMNTSTKALVATISVTGGPRDILTVGNTVYVAAFDAGTIWAINPAQNIETEIIVSGHSPSGFSASGNFLYFVRAKDDRLSLVNLANNTLSDILVEPVSSGGGGGSGIGITPPTTPTENPRTETPNSGDNTGTENPSSDSNQVVDKKLTDRLKGRLLLAVQDHGKIWYVDPMSGQRFQVTLDTAIQVFRRLSLGISNSNLARIFVADSPLRSVLGNRLKGRLLLQVENRGLIWYVDQNGLRHAVTPKNVMEIFRKLALGITNTNLDKIKNGDLN